jgi:hypothetical protein
MKMAAAKNFQQLFNQIQQKITRVLEDDSQGSVQGVARDTMRDMVYQEVYSPYDPVEYQRRMDDGGLSDVENMEAMVYDGDTLIITNVTIADNPVQEGETGRFIAPVVESGRGYFYDFPYSGVPRPFVAKTREELERSGKHVKAMKQGLEKQGLKVK